MILSDKDFGSEIAFLKASKYVAADDPLTDPRTRGYVEPYLKPLGITSMLDAVIQASGQHLGLLCFEHVNKPHSWTRDEIAFACQLADKIGLAIISRMRRQAEARRGKAKKNTATWWNRRPTISGKSIRTAATRTSALVKICSATSRRNFLGKSPFAHAHVHPAERTAVPCSPRFISQRAPFMQIEFRQPAQGRSGKSSGVEARSRSSTRPAGPSVSRHRPRRDRAKDRRGGAAPARGLAACRGGQRQRVRHRLQPGGGHAEGIGTCEHNDADRPDDGAGAA
jgi:hypothetical protein